jgi:hypothetical protein
MPKISQLPALAVATGAETVPVIGADGVTRQGSIAQVAEAGVKAVVQPQIDALASDLDVTTRNLATNTDNVQKNVDAETRARRAAAANQALTNDALAQNTDNVQKNLTGQVTRLDAIPKLLSARDWQPIYSVERPNAVAEPFRGAIVDRFYVAVRVTADEQTTAGLTLWLGDLAGKATIRVSQIRRPFADGDMGNLPPGFGANDVWSATVVPFPIVTTVPNFRTNRAQPVTLDLAPFGVHLADTIYFYVIELLDGANMLANGALGMGNPVTAATPGWGRGWFRSGTNYGRLSEPGTVGDAFAFVFHRLAIRQAAVKPASSQQQAETPDAFDYTKILPDVVIRDAAGTSIVAGGPITFEKPTPVTVAAEQLTLVVGGYASLYYPPLAGSIVVRRASDNSVLVEGTDYKIDYAASAIVSTTFAGMAKVAYTGLPIRYDLVTFSPNTKLRAFTAGLARGFDACEYMPEIRGIPPHPDYADAGPIAPAPQRPLYVVRTDSVGSELIPVHDVGNGVRLADQGEYAALMVRNARILAPVRAKALRKETIRLTIGGTSLNAQGDSQDIVNPNGDRDTVSSFYTTGRLAADTLARITRYNGLPGDPRSPGPGMHQHLGIGWQIKRALELLGGVVDFRNRAVGGSTFAYVGTGALSPDRLAGFYADDPDLIFVDVGENDKGQSYIYTRTAELIAALRANTRAVIYLMPAPFNALSSPGITPEMAGSTYNLALQAALDFDCAVLPHHLIQGPDAHSVTGLSQQDYSVTNGINHFGPRQLLKMGALATVPLLI